MSVSKFLVFGIEAGQNTAKAVMADARCNADVKSDIRRGLTGSVDKKTYTYTVTDEKNPTWYELMFAEIAQ